MILGTRPIAYFLAAAMLALTPTQPCPADEAAAQEKAKAAEKWRPLFDGKTLENWKPTDFGGEGSVVVEEGAIVIEPGQPLSGITWTGKPLPKKDYEIRLEAQRVEGNDFFCALTFPVQDEHCSLVLGGWGGGVVGLSSIDGFDASENETTAYETFEEGKWYKVRVRVTGDRIQAWLNEERIANVETHGKRISVRIEVDPNRPLGVATFQTKGAVRNFEIRELSAEERHETDAKNSATQK